MTQTLTRDPRSATDIEQAVQHARHICERSGQRFTRIREHVYRALLKSAQPVGAYDILDTLEGIGAQKPPTVYRALDWLMELGLAQRIATLSKYVPAFPDTPTEPIAYLLCRECGQAETIDTGPLTASLHRAAQDCGFQKEDTVIEITGLCGAHMPAAAS